MIQPKTRVFNLRVMFSILLETWLTQHMMRVYAASLTELLLVGWCKMDHQLDKLEGKLDRLDGALDTIVIRLGSIDTTLAVQAEQLATHIKRTDLAEENLDHLRAEMKPVQAHVLRVEGALKLIGLIGVIATIVNGIWTMLY